LPNAKATNPIVVIECEWGSGAPVSYADRAIGQIKGKILSVANLDNVIDVQSSTSQSINVTLDDTDGSIKSILDSQDVHQRTARVWQHFHGLDLSDKFLLFAGQISSPVVWSEADRTVSFDIISQIEDREFGFSAEEGEFPLVPKDLVGKPWPVIFGKCLDVPALQVNNAVSGSTLCGVGILSGEALHNSVTVGGTDCALGATLATMQQQISTLNVAAQAWSGVNNARSAELISQANQIRASISSAINAKAQQLQCANQQRAKTMNDAKATGLGCNPVRILGGEDFPQNTTITLNINGGLFTGHMSNDSFTITGRRHPENDAKSVELFEAIPSAQCATPTPVQSFDFSVAVPPGRGDGGGSTVRRHGFILCNEPQKSRPSTPQVAQHFWADAGSRVVMHSDEPITYIVSITPGTVLAVKAFKTLNSERKLVNVPNNLWRVQTTNYGTLSAVEVVVTRPLSTIPDQGWDDDIFVTFESTIGPDTVEIMEWIIDNYTDLEYDPTTFDAVRTKLDPFPANFPVLTRPNTIDLIRDIAFQARCAVWLSNGVFYLKYLPEEPASDATVTTSDIEVGSVEVELTSTEEIITKMNVTWHLSWADEEPPRIILRNHEDRYGVKSQDFDWFIYNQPDTILKAATFWLIRKSNTWKRLRFKAFPNLLNLETFDTVELNLPSYVASSTVKAVVEKADYDSESNTLAFECLVPVRAGSNVAYEWFWPAANANVFAPDGPTSTIGGSLPIGTVPATGTGSVFVGGPNVIFRSGSHRGDKRPGDVGFSAQTIISGSTFADVNASPNPNPNLTLNFIDPMPAPAAPGFPGAETVIDIRTTRVIDSANPGQVAQLEDLLRIRGDQLVIRTQSEFFDGTNQAGFAFRFDDEGDEFAANNAWLKEGEDERPFQAYDAEGMARRLHSKGHRPSGRL
jgi:hypothetical protein